MGTKTIFNIPGEVISHNVFKHLELNDLLRLRRVCKQMKELANDEIWVHGKSKTEFAIFIGEDLRPVAAGTSARATAGCPMVPVPLADVLKMDLKIPTSNFSLSFEVNDLRILFRNEKVQEFVSQYGGQIEELKITRMSVPMWKEERKFYESLVNLKRLSIQEMDASKISIIMPMPDAVTWLFPFPPNFKNLTHFSVNVYAASLDFASKQYLATLLGFCEKLEYYRQPEIIRGGKWEVFLETGADGIRLHQVEQLVRSRRLEGRPNLKFYDMENFKCFVASIYVNPTDLPMFCGRVGLHGLQLLNVKAFLFGGEEIETPLIPFVANAIVSMKNFTRNLLVFDLPHLEELQIISFDCIFEGNYTDSLRPFNKPRWPKLKTLDLRVTFHEMEDGSPTRSLFFFLFENIQRPALMELRIKFGETETGYEDNRHRHKAMFQPNLFLKHGNKPLPAPSCRQIVSSCFNLTKLTIECWPGTNKEICILWAGLLNLEEVVLKDCTDLGDVAFIGEDEKRPIFLQLKKLKKLSLLDVDKMPGITDTAFDIIFRHLELKEFYLSSATPIQSITKKGIRKLLTGVFAETIEKFPFGQWMLDWVSPAEMNKLSLEFRSSFMM